MSRKKSLQHKIQERKEREKREMREKIITAAQNMFIKKGYDKVSIRKIAEEISYSPATIYNYFSSIDEIYFALQDQAFNLFTEKLRETFIVQDPLQRLKIMGQVYVQFALDNPEYYDLMFILKAPMQVLEDSSRWECGFRSYNCLWETVKECIDQGYFKENTVDSTTMAIWSFVHGVSSLVIRDRLKMFPENQQKQIIQDALNSFHQLIH